MAFSILGTDMTLKSGNPSYPVTKNSFGTWYVAITVLRYVEWLLMRLTEMEMGLRGKEEVGTR